MLHDPKRRLRRRPSESAAPEFTLQAESLLKIVDELPPLFVLYGKEHAKSPIDPNWSALLPMAANGVLRTFTARYGGALVGFAFSVVGPHLMHASTPHGITNAIWLSPAYRQGLNGYRFLKGNRDYLLQIGCKRLYIGFDIEHQRQAVLYKRLGYKLEEMSFSYDHS